MPAHEWERVFGREFAALDSDSLSSSAVTGSSVWGAASCASRTFVETARENLVISAPQVWVLPPPNWVISVRTGAVFSVRPDRRLSTMPECSVKARVKQVREKNRVVVEHLAHRHDPLPFRHGGEAYDACVRPPVDEHQRTEVLVRGDQDSLLLGGPREQ